MKSALTLQQFKKYIISFIVSIGCGSLAYVIYIIDPINMITEYNLQMRLDSFMFTMWKTPPVDLNINVYIFNITNSVEFLSGKEKLRVQEIGPYVYKEHLKNENITFNDNGTMSYMPKRTVAFVPELSVNDPTKDFIKIPNVPLLGASSALHDAGFLVNYPLSQLANMLDAKPILDMSVYDYLWGYEDSLVTLVGGIVPNFINFQKFGVLDRMYDEGENIVTMYIQKNEDMKIEKERYLSIDKYNGSPGLAQWGYVDTEGNETREGNTACNTIQGATEGVLLPTNLDKGAIFKVFRKAFCRPLPIMFKKEILTDYGVPGYYYTFKDDFIDSPEQNPDNECYCLNKKKCLKKGLSELTPCYYHIPTATSLPHFLDADPSLLEAIDGLSPDREKHKSYVVIQETFGVPLYGHSKTQTNLIMHHTYYNSKITPFNDKVIPLFWFDVTLPKLPSYIIIMMKLVLHILPIMQTVLIYLLGIGGVITTIWSLGHILRLLHQQQQKQEVPEHVEPDLKIPLCNGNCTSIAILPTVKRTMPKTDVHS